MPLFQTWQSHVSYNTVIGLKVEIRIYAYITDTKYTSKISRQNTLKHISYHSTIVHEISNNQTNETRHLLIKTAINIEELMEGR